MSIPEEFARNLNKAIDRCFHADTVRKRANAKKVIEKLVSDRAAVVGANDARVEFWIVLMGEKRKIPIPEADELLSCLQPNVLYEKGDLVFGWWDDGTFQVHAEELPLIRSNNTNVVSFSRQPQWVGLWKKRGFEEAEPFPVTLGMGETGLVVRFPIARSQVFAQHGYALPCTLQWHWDEEGFFVDRNIIEHGFWKAWKWWGAETMWWYLERSPELFADVNWWDKPELCASSTQR
jgi:hypothetical protein